MNDPAWLRLEFPSGNGFAEVRSIALLYATIAEGGERLGLTPEWLSVLTATPAVPPQGSRDRVMGVESLWHLGFIRPTAAFPFSPSPRTFGMPGMGGSFGFCDPDHQIGYAYAPNRLGILPFDDARERRLRTALYQVIRSIL